MDDTPIKSRFADEIRRTLRGNGWKKWKSDTISLSGTGSPPKVDQFFGLVGAIITPSFNEIGSSLRSSVVLLGSSMTDKQDRSHNHLGGGNYIGIPTFSPRTYPPDISPSQTIPPRPPFLHGVGHSPSHHRHLPIYIKRSVVNVHKIDSG